MSAATGRKKVIGLHMVVHTGGHSPFRRHGCALVRQGEYGALQTVTASAADFSCREARPPDSGENSGGVIAEIVTAIPVKPVSFVPQHLHRVQLGGSPGGRHAGGESDDRKQTRDPRVGRRMEIAHLADHAQLDRYVGAATGQD